MSYSTVTYTLVYSNSEPCRFQLCTLYNDDDEEEDEEEEEHLAPADSTTLPTIDHVPSAEDTEEFETDDSAPTPPSPRLRKARISVRLSPPLAASLEARIVEYVVNKRVTNLAITQRHETHELQVRCEDAQDDRALLRAQYSLLMRGRRYFLLKASSYEREAIDARRAWAHSESRIIYDDDVLCPVDLNLVTYLKVPSKRTTATTTPMTDVAIKVLIAQGVATALAEYEANRGSRNGDDSHDSRSGRRTERVARESYIAGPGEKKVYGGSKPLCPKCNYHHDGQCAPRAPEVNQRVVTCFECGVHGHYKKDCPKLKNNNRGCTLNFLSHPFNIDLMPIELGGFNVIISMDWLVKYHAVIVCDEKIIRIPFGNELLIVRGDGRKNRHESRLNIISCTKTQNYLLKGCDVFWHLLPQRRLKASQRRSDLKTYQLFETFLKDEEKKDAEDPRNEDNEVLSIEEPRVNQEKDANVYSTKNINTVSPTTNAASIKDNVVDKDIVYGCADDPDTPNLEEIVYSNDDEYVSVEANMTNLDTTIPVSPIPTTKIYKDRLVEQIIRDIHSIPQTRRMAKSVTDHGMFSSVQQRINHKDFHNCLFACFLSQVEPKKVIQPLTDPRWIKAM
uniref:Reverse transcriptase domain-containing protein n=1 Tax=Tanacetum cinerariifolium TaxID=118510 RepID=A0A699HJL9_TANCI|nr:reverse transcriptase domain-containing protein [Tanacetum cinerariifolium]